MRVGGQIAFDGDGSLFVALGDMEIPNAAQDSGSFAGKVLRFDADGGVPVDNPAGSAVFAFGFRDPRGLAVDPVGGGVFVVDANSGGHDEINRIAPGTNHGWPSVAGVADTTDEQTFADATAGYRDPLYDSGVSSADSVGGAFNPSTRYGPSLDGHLFVGQGDARTVMRTAPSDDRAALGPLRLFAEAFPADITAVSFTPAGTLYVATRGAIYRIAPIR
jgi:glucose/arabinose dehydrogenase